VTSTEAVTRVIDALTSLNVPYMVVGALSSNVYGRARSTKDADVVVELSDVSISRVAALVGGGFELDPQMSFETISSTTRYQLRHRETAFLIELFMLRSEPFDQSRFARRTPRRLGERTVFVPTAEDVIVQKLRWSLHPGRQKDVEDVAGIIAVQAGRLDLAYIRGWCDQHGTRALFERLLGESSDDVPPPTDA
jgi:hypothetical protein